MDNATLDFWEKRATASFTPIGEKRSVSHRSRPKFRRRIPTGNSG